MGYIDIITEFLLSEKSKLSAKAAVVFFAILTIIIINDVLGFSYYYATEKKLEQVEKLNSIINNSQIDSTTKAFAMQLRSETIARENIITKAISYFGNKSTNSKSTLVKDSATIFIVKSNFWWYATTGGLYYLLAIFVIPGMLMEKKIPIIQRLATGILYSIVFVLWGLFFYWACTFIPQISSTSWVWNYIINFIIQVIVIILLIREGRKVK